MTTVIRNYIASALQRLTNWVRPAGGGGPGVEPKLQGGGGPGVEK